MRRLIGNLFRQFLNLFISKVVSVAKFAIAGVVSWAISVNANASTIADLRVSTFTAHPCVP